MIAEDRSAALAQRSRNDARREALPSVVVGALLLLGGILSGCVPSDPVTIELLSAIEQDDLAVVKHLVEQGVSVERTDSVGRTPLYVAALCRKSEIVEYLLSQGADPQGGVSWKSERLPIHAAAQVGANEIVTIFLDQGIDVNVRDRAGLTPLHEAAWNHHPETVALLLSRGAKANIRDKNGYPPSIPRWDFPNKLPPEKFPKYRQTLGILLEHGLDINMGGGHRGMTPLIYAAFVGDVETADLLLSRGADPSVRSRFTEEGTALSVAKREGHQAVVTLLEKHQRMRAGTDP